MNEIKKNKLEKTKPVKEIPSRVYLVFAIVYLFIAVCVTVLAALLISRVSNVVALLFVLALYFYYLSVKDFMTYRKKKTST